MTKEEEQLFMLKIKKQEFVKSYTSYSGTGKFSKYSHSKTYLDIGKKLKAIDKQIEEAQAAVEKAKKENSNEYNS
jgi:hypothetical protein